MLEKTRSSVGNFSVMCCWRGIIDGFEWVGTRLYGSARDEVRNDLWDEVRGIRQQWNHLWCVFGDFNVVRFPSERLGCHRVSFKMVEFFDFIEKQNLVDLPLNGGMYTWCNGTTNPSISRIDKVLILADWEEHYSDVMQKLLPKPISDHSPILVEREGGWECI